MWKFLADVAFAWLRGSLHGLNGVLFAKYLALAWGFEPGAAAALSGTVSGVCLMRGKLWSVLQSAWNLRADCDGCDPCPDAPNQATGLAKKRSGFEPR